MILSKYFVNHNSKISIIAVQNIVNFSVSGPISIMFIYVAHNGFEFTYMDLFYGIVTGILNLVVSFLTMIAVIKGKPGAADALIETSTIFVTILDSLIFLRTPTNLQIFCILLSFCATVIIVMTNKKH